MPTVRKRDCKTAALPRANGCKRIVRACADVKARRERGARAGTTRARSATERAPQQRAPTTAFPPGLAGARPIARAFAQDGPLRRLQAFESVREPPVLVLERAQRQDQSVLALSPALELGALPHEVLLDAVEPPLRAALDEARQLELARRALLTERRIGALRFRPREIALECRHALEVGALAAAGSDRAWNGEPRDGNDLDHRQI